MTSNETPDPALKRRMLTQRSHTVAALPSCAHIIEEINANTDNNDARGDGAELTLLPGSGNGSPVMTCRHSSLEGDRSDHEQELLQFDGTTASASTTTSSKGGKIKKTRFQSQRGVTIIGDSETLDSSTKKKRSVTMAPTAVSTTHSKSSSTSSTLLERVRERIREKLFESSEWPNAVAMMQEKRARANNALEASLTHRKDLNLAQIQIHELTKKKSGRSKSDSKYEMGVMSTEGQNVRQAFIRRRSISEDTYDRHPIEQLKAAGLIPNEELEQTSPQKTGPCLIRRSPVSIKKQFRATSLDSAKLTHMATVEGTPCLLSPGSTTSGRSPSVTSSASTVCSDKIPEGSIVASTSGIPHESDTQDTSPSALPDVIFDKRRDKDSILEELEEPTDAESQDDGTPAEVVFDEHGQTWDVYGADFDPSILGMAIQTHLEQNMRRKSEVHGGILGINSDTSSDPDSANTCPKNSGRASRAAVKNNEESFWVRFFCLYTNRQRAS